jgi:hypothetical protein
MSAMIGRVLSSAVLCTIAASALAGAQLRVRISVGEQVAKTTAFFIRVLPGTASSRIEFATQPAGSGSGSTQKDVWSGMAGGGKITSAIFTLTYDDLAARPAPMHVMWTDLIAHSDADTARRLSNDDQDATASGAARILFGKEQTRGFTVTAHQLLRQKAIWIPEYDVFLTLDDRPVSFADHQASLQPFAGKRILEQVAKEPEATYRTFTAKWSDMGSPYYVHPHQPAPGHIIGLAWDSSIPKFGIDRASGVWNDYGNPDHFRFWFGFGDLNQGVITSWRSQRLDNGLPIVTTTIEDDGIRYEVEQFAYPLNGPPSERKGEIKMVLLQKVRLTNLDDTSRVVPVSMTERRQLPMLETGASVETVKVSNGALLRERARRNTLLAIQGIEDQPQWHETLDYESEDKRAAGSVRIDLVVSEHLGPKESREFVVKLPSPIVDSDEESTFTNIDYTTARAATERFWTGWLDRGAQIRVPEKEVNDLFRASLWHALRLPRRHDGSGSDNPVIDLPYSNFAYAQTGIPWPGVQSIYVDYMLFELRGYFSVALEDLLQEFRLNQDSNGHVSGFANWTMYTPSMLYAGAQYYLLSHDRKGFESLLPYALKALSWCENESKKAQARDEFQGLIDGPLNDGTGEGIWAINQAYMYAGLERFGTALKELGDSHAQEALDEAQRLRSATENGFEGATSKAPLVQLRDHTWQPYVPSDAKTPRRLMEIWYPTDVDTGALHLLRLKALDADGRLANFLLNDHEDNLFLKGWGAANEPVYAPQGLAYLYRDDAVAAIRTFYSQMACAFSQTVYEPVEHRWMHGQYFGPPSTDGSWFELLRHMLVRELDSQTLLIGQAAPRSWLADGKQIEVEKLPTAFGVISLQIASHASANTISARVDLAPASKPGVLLIRLRHPEKKIIRSVSVNGREWKDFDPKKEWVRLEKLNETHYEISASY